MKIWDSFTATRLSEKLWSSKFSLRSAYTRVERISFLRIALVICDPTWTDDACCRFFLSVFAAGSSGQCLLQVLPVSVRCRLHDCSGWLQVHFDGAPWLPRSAVPQLDPRLLSRSLLLPARQKRTNS